MSGFLPRPMSAEDWISRISPVCALQRSQDGIEMTLMGSIRLQALAYFATMDINREAALKQPRRRHANWCGNQNAIHPEGAYEGVEECGCDRRVCHDEAHH
jgi:hypothetical protein